MDSSLPNLVVIGAMKCGTTALHGILAEMPDIQMSEPKETDFFVDPEARGLDWYRSLFDSRYPVRGESSPGYTSPDHPEAPAHMRELLPDVRLVYLVRDPAERALSQYLHHQRDGDEQRPAEEAVLDPDSQYLARSRYHERLLPYLERFDREQLLVVVQERLRDRPAHELVRIRRHVGLPADDETPPGRPAPPARPAGGAELRRAVHAAVADDLERLRALLDDPLPEWGP